MGKPEVVLIRDSTKVLVLPVFRIVHDKAQYLHLD